jgi:hypothetical protein
VQPAGSRPPSKLDCSGSAAAAIRVGHVRATAPEDCNPLGCEDESNDGVQQYVGDIPRPVPGIVGAETRPDGH